MSFRQAVELTFVLTYSLSSQVRDPGEEVPIERCVVKLAALHSSGLDGNLACHLWRLVTFLHVTRAILGRSSMAVSFALASLLVHF